MEESLSSRVLRTFQAWLSHRDVILNIFISKCSWANDLRVIQSLLEIDETREGRESDAPSGGSSLSEISPLRRPLNTKLNCGCRK
jgi:hypothetical protein